MPAVIMVILLGAFLLSGCTTIHGPQRFIDVNTQLKELEPYKPSVDASGKLDQAKKVTEYQNTATNEKERKRLRDEIINARILATDLYFTDFERKLAREHGLANIGADWVVIGLDGAAALAPAIGTARVLAAISGGITGAKGSVNEHLFYRATIPALVAQMRAERKKVLVKIRRRMKQPDDMYPLMEALINLEEYYKAGTIPGALKAILNDAGEKAAKASKDLEELDFRKLDDAGYSLWKWLHPEGTFSDTNSINLEVWIIDKVSSRPSQGDFLLKPEFAEFRKNAVDELVLKKKPAETEDELKKKLSEPGFKGKLDGPGQKIYDWLLSENKFKERKDALEAWLKENITKRIEIPHFLKGKEYAAEREKAVKDPTLAIPQ